MAGGFSKVLTKGKKDPWITMPLIINAYTMKDFREVEAEAKQVRGFFLPPASYRTYVPERIIPAHYKRAKFKWIYQHTDFLAEDRVKNWYRKYREATP